MPIPINSSEVDVARFWSRVDKRGPKDCWEWTGRPSETGYGRFRVCGVQYYAHRVAFTIVNGDTELDVLHTCDHPWCCNPAHLYAGTAADNRRDCVERGRAADQCGEDNGYAKLTESDVHVIRKLRADGWLYREIAEKYGISRWQVSNICRGESWKHI